MSDIKISRLNASVLILQVGSRTVIVDQDKPSAIDISSGVEAPAKAAEAPPPAQEKAAKALKAKSRKAALVKRFRPGDEKLSFRGLVEREVVEYLATGQEATAHQIATKIGVKAIDVQRVTANLVRSGAIVRTGYEVTTGGRSRSIWSIPRKVNGAADRASN